MYSISAKGYSTLSYHPIKAMQNLLSAEICSIIALYLGGFIYLLLNITLSIYITISKKMFTQLQNLTQRE